MNNSKRDSSVDIIKGIGIILLVIGHCIGFFQNQTESLSDDIINSIINSFHMPLFFFVGGVLYVKKALVKCAFSRVESLLVPLIIYSIINGLFVVLVYGLDYIIAFPEEIRTILLQTLKLQGGWFLISYFLVCIIYPLINVCFSNVALIICGGLVLALSVSHIDKNGMPSYILTAFVGLFFYWIGAIVKKTIEPRLPKRNSCILMGILLIIICSVSNIVFPNEVRLYSNTYGNWFLFLINAVLGCIGTYLIGKGIYEQAILELIGKLSLPIMAVQFPVYIGLCNYVADHESMKFFARFPYCIVLWSATLVTSTVIAHVFGHTFPAFAGKWRYKELPNDSAT